MKIRGTTITTPLARHAVPDDSVVSKKPWSSMNTVDKLCPSFTEQGAVVTCEPLEGYPLTVTASAEATKVTRTGKNLFDFKPPVSLVTFTASSGVSERYGYAVRLPAGTYTIKASDEGALANKYIYCAVNGKDGAYIAQDTEMWLRQGDKFKTLTFSLNDGEVLYVHNGQGPTSTNGKEAASNELFRAHNIQIEVGSTATDYEQYRGREFAVGEDVPALAGVNYLWADVGEITVEGKKDLAKIVADLMATVSAITGV